jgi:hypothetical protein
MNPEIHPFPHVPVGIEGRIGLDRDALDEEGAVGESAGKGVVTHGHHLTLDALELIIRQMWKAGDDRISKVRMGLIRRDRGRKGRFGSDGDAREGIHIPVVGIVGWVAEG